MRIRRLRLMLTGGLLAISAPLALAGVWIVDLLYDDRYISSGAVLVAMSLALIPQIIALTYDQVALARGDSRGFFLVTAFRAALLVGLLLVLVPVMGKLGAATAIALTPLISYPLLVRLARRHGAWDSLHDLVTALAALLVGYLQQGLQMVGIPNQVSSALSGALLVVVVMGRSLSLHREWVRSLFRKLSGA
jgi:O-antigen/teichoic acid export membrane protein